MSDKTKQNLISVLIGLGAGVFMCLLVLNMMIACFFDMASISYDLILVAAAAVPLCLSFLKKWEWNVLLIQIVMIVTSFVITMIYGFYVTYAGSISQYSVFWVQVAKASALVHGVSLAVSLVSAGWHHHTEKK